MVLVKRLHSNTSVSMQASTTVEIKFNYQLHFREYHFLQETTELIIRLIEFLYLLISCEREKNLFLKSATM